MSGNYLEWQVKDLGSLAGGPFGSSLGTQDYVPSGVPVIRGSNLASGGHFDLSECVFVSETKAEALARNLALPGDLILTQRGTLGQVGIVPNEPYDRYVISQSQMRLRVNPDRADANYLYYLFRDPLMIDKIEGHAISSGVPHINLGILGDLRVRLPSVRRQRDVASVLQAVDSKIAANALVCATLAELGSRLFQSWFVDLEPAQVDRAHMARLGVPGDSERLFSSGLADSPGGPIPKGWCWTTIGRAVSSLFDGPHATPAPASSGAVFLGIKNLPGTTIDLSEVRHISDADWPKWTQRVVPEVGDIVFTYEAALGRFAIIPPDLKCCLGRRVALVRPKERSHAEFLFATFTSSEFQTMLLSRANTGSTVDRIPLEDFPGYSLLWPGDELVNLFNRIAGPWFSLRQAQEAESRTLTHLRDTLLPPLLSGDLRIKDAERIVGKAI